MTKEPMLSINYMNIQSVRNKFDELQCFLEKQNCDILVLAETWLQRDEVKYFNLEDYNAIHACREGRAGGVSIYIKNHINYKILQVIDGLSPYNFICIALPELKLEVCGIYRPPRYLFTDFMDSFQNILLNQKNKTIIIGDININVLDGNSDETIEYSNMLTVRNYRIANIINGDNATRISNTMSLIDHVLINKNLTCNVSVMDYAISDHKPLTIGVNIHSTIFKPKAQKTVEIVNKKVFKKKFDILCRNTETSINSFNNLVTMIQKCKTEASHKIMFRHREGNGWMTYDIQNLIKQRDKLYKQLNMMKKNNTYNENLENSYKKAKNIVSKEIRKQKYLFFKNSWDRAGTDSKKQWKIINNLLNQNKTKEAIATLSVNKSTISNPYHIANEFNSYFTSIGQSIVASLDNDPVNANFTEFREIEQGNTMYIKPTTEEEIKETLLSLKINSAAGFDNISVKDLILLKDNLVPILTKLINDVFITGIFPEILKVGKITPIHKAGNKDNVQNYRPITVVCSLSKIIETLIKSRMLEFITKYIGFDEYQYGFIKKSNTLSATTDLINSITSDIDKRKTVIAVFIDLKKAFDVVNHPTLLNKLSLIGIRGKVLSIIETYLQDRPQFVKIENISSDEMMNNCGVPQGSILGPLLYSLMVLSMRLAALTGRYFNFADDTVLLYSGTSNKQLETDINEDLLRFTSWLRHNKLKINSDKTVFMIFQQKNTPYIDIDLKINNASITRVEFAKYLGLIIDDKLTWRYHMAKLSKKIIAMLGALSRCSDFLNSSNRNLIYSSFILSHIRYLINIWGTCGTSLHKKLQVSQNTAIKILFKKHYRTSTESLYNQTGLQPIKYYLELEQCKQIYKILAGNLKCNSKITINNEIYSHNTRGKNDIYIEHMRTNKGLFNPLTQSFLMYNSLPICIREITSYNVFVNNLKCFLRTKSYL